MKCTLFTSAIISLSAATCLAGPLDSRQQLNRPSTSVVRPPLVTQVNIPPGKTSDERIMLPTGYAVEQYFEVNNQLVSTVDFMPPYNLGSIVVSVHVQGNPVTVQLVQKATGMQLPAGPRFTNQLCSFSICRVDFTVPANTQMPLMAVTRIASPNGMASGTIMIISPDSPPPGTKK